ncbi:NAD-dependent epimerase/dehydratase family protein [Candidatus Pelagibacter bacterium nBUS_25]|uniref:NAD-dependent epimerase/dehydratase family protein n=1 Tax=Candidatus Pelagibacter bacterium nBUS_25 TaxID=3374187 RepID=UPI003EBD15C2
MKILVTGAAGFIGSHLSKLLSKKKHIVYGIDNISDYYDKKLKLDRLKWIKGKNFIFNQIDILDKKSLDLFISKNSFDLVIHLAAQPGVVYSIENPFAYIENNIMGYLNLLEICKKRKIFNIIYASSSSVYGKKNKTPFEENQKIDSPLTIYSATKITDEYISFVYSNLFSMNFVGLRFFTVYGPWGRPDMSPYIFLNKIINNSKITLYDKGNGIRDFTYIDDIVVGIYQIVKKFKKEKKLPSHEIYNLGLGKPITTKYFLSQIEKILKKKAKIKLDKNRKADMKVTYSNSSKFKKHFNYEFQTKTDKGLKKFLKWYKKYKIK